MSLEHFDCADMGAFVDKPLISGGWERGRGRAGTCYLLVAQRQERPSTWCISPSTRNYVPPKGAQLMLLQLTANKGRASSLGFICLLFV